MKTLKTLVKEHLLKEREERSHAKTTFYPTEADANVFDIYHSFKGTPLTNPIDVTTQFALGMRKKLEEAVVGIFDKMELCVSPKPYTDLEGTFIEEPEQHRVDMERHGIRITGYMDAIITEIIENADVDNQCIEVPVEIKTSYGIWQKNELLAGKPKESYVKQLAIYMDSLGVNKGYLLQVHFEKDLIIDDIYQFVIIREGDIFKCGNFQFNINDVYKRWKRLYDCNIVPDIEPKSEYMYKYPLDKIIWRNLSGTQIANARNNRAVIGDWQVKYSGYKDLIIEKEGCGIGYSDEELAQIKEQTKGYTTWPKPAKDAPILMK